MTKSMKQNHISHSYTFSFNLFVSLTGLFTCLFISSLRSVWILVNRFVTDVVPLGEHSFFVVYLVVIGILFTSFISLFRLYRAKGANQHKKPILLWVYLCFQLLLYWGLIVVLYPEVESMYLQLLPSKLLQNGVLPASFVIAALCAYYGWHRNTAVKNIFVLANCLLLVGVLSITYMAVTVRLPHYYANLLPEPSDKLNGYPVIDHAATPRFSEGDERLVQPDYSLELDSEFGGNYWLAGDLDGDDQVEIITLRYYVQRIDTNRVVSFAVQNLHGERLWHWKSDVPAPANIGMGRGSSAAAVVYDLKRGIGKNKLLLSTDGYLYQFNGPTGEIEKQIEVGAIDSSDAIIIANLRGKGKKDLLLKDAYHTVWAFDEDLNLLWKQRNPGGRLLAHRIAAYDLTGNGTDEIITGSVILNGDGSIKSRFESPSIPFWYGGHIDGIVPIKQGDQWFLGVTYCDASAVALYDIEGNNLWEITGEHFEYLVGGYFYPDDEQRRDQFQLISKVHYIEGNPQALVNQDGKMIALYNPGGTAFAADWTGDGYHELIFYSPASIYRNGEKIADLAIPDIPDGHSSAMRVADFIGTGFTGNSLTPDGIPDIGIRSEVNGKYYLHLYTNRQGKKPINYVYPGIGWEEAANYFSKYYDYIRSH